MTNLLSLIVGIYGVCALGVAHHGWHEAVIRKNPFGVTPHLHWLGIFVWGDAPVIATYWVILSLVALYMQNIWFVIFAWSIFWVVRSSGEVSYWIGQQFSTHVRNKPADLWGHTLFPGDSIWFVYQIVWQCLCATMLILAVYSGYHWLD